jgi:hypothetical protein
MVSDSQSIRITPSSQHCNCNPYYSLQCYLITLLLPNFLSNIESPIPRLRLQLQFHSHLQLISPITIPPSLIPHS